MGELVPLHTLRDSSGAEITHATSSLTSTLGAGSYSIQVEPETGGGFYLLTLSEVIAQAQFSASASLAVNPSSVNVGDSALMTVSLDTVPAEGYTSAEFSCAYDASLVEVSNIVATSLFGADAAVAVNGPQNGSFIVAVAGSNGNKATSAGDVFTFSAKGLQAGQVSFNCAVKVSKGDDILTQIAPFSISLMVTDSTPTPTFTPTETATPTSTPVESPTATPPTSVDTATPSATPAESPTPTSTFTPMPSPTSTPPTIGTITGQVLAGKPVTISLYDLGNVLIASAAANPDGTFSLTAPGGTYRIRATASGFLSAEGIATIPTGGSTSMPTVTLLAGDIDNNEVINQLDALTIGMSYNTSTPTAADLNNDGTINVLDLELLAENYRKTGPIAWQVSYPYP